MSATHDELAGVVDLFGALTPDELTAALAELAFKDGRDVDETALENAVADAVEAYVLLPVPGDAVEGYAGEADPLVPGPAAFPTLPDHAEDLPHIMDVPERRLDREAAVTQVERRLREDAVDAIGGEDPDRLALLLDVTYDVETWGPVELGELRDRLADARDAAG